MRRRIPPTRQTTSGRMPSRHAPGMVEFESGLERKFLILLEANRHLRSVRTQPITLRLNVGGRSRSYTPDVEVEWRDDIEPPFGYRRAVFEVKPFEVLRKKYADLAPKLRAARDHFEREGVAFKVITDRTIDGPWLAQAELMVNAMRERRPLVSETLAAQNAIRMAGGALEIAELKRRLDGVFQWPQERDKAIWFWLAHGSLEAADRCLITDSTPVHWCATISAGA